MATLCRSRARSAAIIPFVQKTALKRRGTEERNPRSRELDRLSTLALVRVINHEDATVPLAVRRELPAIARAVDAIVRALSRWRSG